jgi:transcriptional regulator with XRE-family HTH domain
MPGVEPVAATRSNCRAYRAAAGLSQQHLAGLARTTCDAVRRCEKGTIFTTELGVLIRISAALDCGVADLFPALGAVREPI